MDTAAYYFSRAEKAEGEAGNLGCLWEIKIDAKQTAAQVKAIKVPVAMVPVTAKTTTSASVTVVSAK